MAAESPPSDSAEPHKLPATAGAGQQPPVTSSGQVKRMLCLAGPFSEIPTSSQGDTTAALQGGLRLTREHKPHSELPATEQPRQQHREASSSTHRLFPAPLSLNHHVLTPLLCNKTISIQFFGT